MNPSLKSFSDYLFIKNIPYSLIEDRVIQLAVPGRNCPCVKLFFAFDTDGKTVTVLSKALATVDCDNPAKMALAYAACAGLNTAEQEIRFRLDEGGVITATGSIVIDPSTAGEACYVLLLEAVHIVDTAYPVLKNALQ